MGEKSVEEILAELHLESCVAADMGRCGSDCDVLLSLHAAARLAYEDAAEVAEHEFQYGPPRMNKDSIPDRIRARAEEIRRD